MPIHATYYIVCLYKCQYIKRSSCVVVSPDTVSTEVAKRPQQHCSCRVGLLASGNIGRISLSLSIYIYIYIYIYTCIHNLTP